MEITFLQATVPLTKTFEKRPDGTISKSSYPNVYEVTTHRETLRDMRELEQLIKAYAAKAYCLVKGNPTKDLHKQSRAGTTDSSATTDWVCFDIDGLPSTVPETFLAALSLSDVSYVIQYSASYGIENKDLRCHIFMQLDKPMAAPLLKQWLIELNLTTPLLNSSIRLSKTGNALSWPLDISACQNDKLLYISPPTLKGLRDPLPKNGRVQFVRKDKDTLTINHAISTTAKNRERAHKRLDELRDAEGLPKRKTSYRMHGGLEVMVKPDVCTVTEVRQERGFVYFNLNGGDSWAYYHPENSPAYIHTFKGEPSYLTKELLPAYWESLQTQAYRVTSSGLIHLAFLDRATSTYYRGTYDPVEDILDIAPAKNESMVRQYADANGMRLGPNIPEWTMSFNPDDSVRVDFDNRTVNTFERTTYQKTPVKNPTKKPMKCPPKIFSIIEHILCKDLEAIEHFINWTACIAQNLYRTRTAWVFQGVPGTGKGILFERVLSPLFGVNQTVIKRSGELTEKWTDFVEGKFIVFIDEIQTSALRDESGVIANMKSLITNTTAQIRMMNRNSYSVENYTNWIFASNKPDPVSIDKNDRRFNVGPYQSVAFPKPTDEWLDAIADELQDFHNYLMCYQVDKMAAGTPLESQARNTLIALSQSTAESTASALTEGDMSYFVDQLPTDDKYKTDMQKLAKVTGYRRTLYDVIQRTRPDGTCNVTRDELFTIFDYTVGGMNPSPTSFTKYLGHRQIEIKPVSINQRVVRGIQTTWSDPGALPALIKSHFNDMAKSKATP